MIETKVLDSELPLEENCYEHGENICKAKELSFAVISFYNMSGLAQSVLTDILKAYGYKIGYPNKIGSVDMISIIL